MIIKVFIKQFNRLIIDKKSNNSQINNINKTLKSLSLKKSPYYIAAKSIKNYL